MTVGSIGSSTGFDPAQMAQRFFKKADANGDGSIDKSELKTMLASGPNGKSMTDEEVDKVFAQVDTNGDGKIDETENENQMKKMGGGKGGQPPAGGPPPGGGAKGAGASGGSASSNKVYDSRDTNKDGTVSYQEQVEWDQKHPEEAEKSNGIQQGSSGYNDNGAKNTGSALSTIDIEA
jgi:hypothetical protein